MWGKYLIIYVIWRIESIKLEYNFRRHSHRGYPILEYNVVPEISSMRHRVFRIHHVFLFCGGDEGGTIYGGTLTGSRVLDQRL